MKLAVVVKSGQQCSAQNSSDLTESFEEINATRSHGIIMDPRGNTAIIATKLILTYIQLFGNKATKLK